MKIKVLGTGCAKCNKLTQATQEAVAELQLNATVEKVEDIQAIMQYSVMRTPALVVNEKVVLSGELLSVAKLKELLQAAI